MIACGQLFAKLKAMQWTAGIPEDGWNDKLFGANGHFLQSTHWAAFQEALGRQVFYAAAEGWQALAIVEESRAARRLYCPYGPVAKNSRALGEALEALRTLAAQHRAVFVRVEPQTGAQTAEPQQLRKLGLRPALKDIQPKVTWVQDLTKTPEQLLAEFTATKRNLYNNYHTKGLAMRQSRRPEDVPAFVKLMQGMATHNGITVHSEHYYRTMAAVLLPRGAAALYLTEHEGNIVAAALAFDTPVTRYYAYAAADAALRKLSPATPLLAQMLLDAQVAGQKEFDFMGVAPPDAPKNHSWAGLSQFKQDFGGKYKHYAGTWELPVKPLQYAAYRAAYTLGKAVKAGR
jgi:lipid II:glycine glycyltransferase (peptidoglycan interpeptide bridge formation enzyme)